MITSLDGSALVIAAAGKTVAEPMMPLNAHTLVELRAGAKMSIVFFSKGSHERFTGPALIGIGHNRAKVFKGEESSRQVVSTGSSLIQSIDPHALNEAPSSGGVSVSTAAGKTTISWQQGSAPGPYLVEVYKPAQGDTPRSNVWSEELAGTSVDYSGPDLSPDTTYVAEVHGMGGSQFRIVEGSAEILGAAREEADQMSAANPDDTTPHVLMHTLYGQLGQNRQAALALQPAIEAQPDENAFVRRLNVMGQRVNRQANVDTAVSQAVYRADDWTYSPFWDAESWSWNGWDE
jgi:hypothetical protein